MMKQEKTKKLKELKSRRRNLADDPLSEWISEFAMMLPKGLRRTELLEIVRERRTVTSETLRKIDKEIEALEDELSEDT